MPYRSALEVAIAAQKGIDLCRGAEVPFARLAEFLEELRQQDWWEADLWMVERTIRHYIVALAAEVET